MTTTDEDRELDKFYTKREVARACVERALSLIKAEGVIVKHWLEPSAGSGAFLDALPEPKTGIDLKPEHPDVIEADFLTWAPDERLNQICAIGNPPFGKNSSLAVRFFNHAAAFCDVIAMILPATFQKDSVQKRLNAKFHLFVSEDVGDFAFELGGESRHVPCVFQIWVKRGENRVKDERPITTNLFSFTDKTQAFCAVQRVGVNAGRVKTDLLGLSPSSHYFLKAGSVGEERLLTALRQVNFDVVKRNTAGNPSVSKRELVFLCEKAIKDGD